MFGAAKCASWCVGSCLEHLDVFVHHCSIGFHLLPIGSKSLIWKSAAKVGTTGRKIIIQPEKYSKLCNCANLSDIEHIPDIRYHSPVLLLVSSAPVGQTSCWSTSVMQVQQDLKEVQARKCLKYDANLLILWVETSSVVHDGEWVSVCVCYFSSIHRCGPV